MFASGAFSASSFSPNSFAGLFGQPEVTPSNAYGNSRAPGGTGDDAGVGYVKTDHGWVRLTKVARAGARTFSASVSSRSDVEGYTSVSITSPIDIEVAVKLAAAGALSHVGSRATSLDVGVSSDVRLGKGQVSACAKHCTVEWLNGDELIIILEELT